MKHVNQSLVNAPQNNKLIVVEKEQYIMKKYAEIRKIRRNTMKKGVHKYENEKANTV